MYGISRGNMQVSDDVDLIIHHKHKLPWSALAPCCVRRGGRGGAGGHETRALPERVDFRRCLGRATSSEAHAIVMLQIIIHHRPTNCIPSTVSVY